MDLQNSKLQRENVGLFWLWEGQLWNQVSSAALGFCSAYSLIWKGFQAAFHWCAWLSLLSSIPAESRGVLFHNKLSSWKNIEGAHWEILGFCRDKNL
jgi:hypothetical protein